MAWKKQYHGLTLAKSWVQRKPSDSGDLCHGPAMNKRPIVETVGKIHHDIAVGCSRWHPVLTAGCEDPWLMVHVCAHMRLCTFSQHSRFLAWSPLEIELCSVNLFQVPFLAPPGRRLICHGVRCSLPSETIKHFVSIFIRPGFNLWYLSRQAITVWLFL